MDTFLSERFLVSSVILLVGKEIPQKKQVKSGFPEAYFYYIPNQWNQWTTPKKLTFISFTASEGLVIPCNSYRVDE